MNCKICGIDITEPAPGATASYLVAISPLGGVRHMECLKEEDHVFERRQELYDHQRLGDFDRDDPFTGTFGDADRTGAE